VAVAVYIVVVIGSLLLCFGCFYCTGLRAYSHIDFEAVTNVS